MDRTNAPVQGTPLDEAAILDGDTAAFEQLVRQESPRLFRVILNIVRAEDDARSVMQETYLQAYQRLHTFRGDSKLTTWIYGIGINLARSHVRKAMRNTSLDEADLDRMQPRFDKGMYVDSFEAWDPQRVAETSERHRIVHEAIDKLPPDYRTVVTLRDIQELNTQETSQILGVSEGAVRVRLHRARQALRELLDEHFR